MRVLAAFMAMTGKFKWKSVRYFVHTTGRETHVFTEPPIFPSSRAEVSCNKERAFLMVCMSMVSAHRPTNKFGFGGGGAALNTVRKLFMPARAWRSYVLWPGLAAPRFSSPTVLGVDQSRSQTLEIDMILLPDVLDLQA